MKKYSIYYTSGSSQNENNAFDVVFNSQSNLAGSAGLIDPDAFNFNLKSTPSILIAKVIEDGKSVTVQRLVTFYGEPSYLKLKQQFDAAIAGNFDDVKPGTAGNEYQEDGLDLGLPIGWGENAFPFVKVPSILWLIGAAYSGLRLMDTGNPVYAGTGVYSYLHYLKNKNK